MTGSKRCRLVFYGDTDPNQPREAALERLRRLLKDSPDLFARRLERMPLVLLPDTDPSTARGYQRLLAQKGILCRVEDRDAASLEDPSGQHRSVEKRREAVSDARLAHPPEASRPEKDNGRWNSRLNPLALGLDMCFNPRGVIGRVLSQAPYRAALMLAAGVGLAQAGGAAFNDFRGGFLALMLTIISLLVFAPVMGIGLMYLRGFLLHAAGRLLHGKAGPREVRIALAWSEIPLLLGGLTALLQIMWARFGLPPLIGGLDSRLPAVLGQVGFGMLQAAMGLWAFSLLMHSLAEIQGFGLARSFASIVLAALVVLIPLAAVGGLLIGAGLLPLH